MLKWIQSSVWWSVCYKILSERASWHNLKILTKTLMSWKLTWEIWKIRSISDLSEDPQQLAHRSGLIDIMSTTCRHVSIIQPTIRGKIMPTGRCTSYKEITIPGFLWLLPSFYWLLLRKTKEKGEAFSIQTLPVQQWTRTSSGYKELGTRTGSLWGDPSPQQRAQLLPDPGRNLLVKYVGSRGNDLGTGPLPAAEVGRGVGRK